MCMGIDFSYTSFGCSFERNSIIAGYICMAKIRNFRKIANEDDTLFILAAMLKYNPYDNKLCTQLFKL